MLESGVWKLKGNLGASLIKNTDLQANATGLTGQAQNSMEDMNCGLLEGISMVVDRVFGNSSFCYGKKSTSFDMYYV